MVACLIIVSSQDLSFENLTLNFEFLSSDLKIEPRPLTGHWTLTWTFGPDLELDNINILHQKSVLNLNQVKNISIFS